MSYDTKKRCHVCHGHGVKITAELKKITCPRCEGSGLPQPIKHKCPKKPWYRKPRKYDGIESLDKVEAV